MRVHIHETDRALAAAAASQQTPEDDAAVAAENEHERAVVACGGNLARERPRVSRDVVLIPRTPRRPHEVPIRRRFDVAAVARIETRDEILLSQDARRQVQAAGSPVVVRTDTNARRRANECDWAGHMRLHLLPSVQVIAAFKLYHLNSY
jgi:hypothetical protein